MDVGLVSAIFTCLLTRALSQSNPGSTVTPVSKQNQSEPSVSGPAWKNALPPPPALGLLTIHWTHQSCEGEVQLMLPDHGPSSCFPAGISQAMLEKFQQGQSEVCRGRLGCGGEPHWHKDNNTNCPSLRVTCTVSPGGPSWATLKAYKVATGLLSVVVLLVLLVLLGKIFQVLHNRFSGSRPSPWIGPTQSQSVSYHRGKSVVENNPEKRSSYPALERLMVSDGREPSSNRNSDLAF